MGKKKTLHQPQAKLPSPWIQRILDEYGDLLYDFCQGVLWSPTAAPLAFKQVIRSIRREEKRPRFERYERPWVLQVASRVLIEQFKKTPRRLTPAEQVMLDSNPDPKARLRHFDSYFHRLPIESQILLILKDKYQIPYAEISSALGLPEATLKLQRQLALRGLEEWIWSETDAVL